MGNQVKSAMGSHKQFTPRPESLYQPRLEGIDGHIQIEAKQSSKMQQLAHALGVLGKEVNKTADAKLDSEIKIGEADGKAFYRKFTAEQWQALDTIQAMQDAGLYDLSDNKFAVAAVDRLRGQQSASRTEAEYQNYRLNRDKSKPLTWEEEIKDRQTFLSAGKAAALVGVSNKEIFESGWSESTLVGDVQTYNQFQKEKTVEAQQTRIGGLSAKLGELRKGAWQQMSAEELSLHISTLLQENSVAGGDAFEKVQILAPFFKDMAKTYGEDGKRAAIAESVIVGVNPDGSMMYLKDIYDPGQDDLMAGVRSYQLNTEFPREVEGRWGSMSVEELDTDWLSYQRTLNGANLQTALEVYQRVRTLKEQEKKVKIQMSARTQAAAGAEKNILDRFRKEWVASKNGWSTLDDKLTPRATSLSGVKVKGVEIDANGNMKEKEYTADENQATYAFASFYSEVMNSSDFSEEDKNREVMRLYEMPVFDVMKKTFKTDIQNSLDHLSAENPAIPQQLKDGIAYYKHDPNVFSRVFGSDTTGQVSTLVSLAHNAGENLEVAGQRYALGRERLKDPEVENAVKYALASHITRDSKLSDFFTLDGRRASLNMSIMANEDIYRSVVTTAMYDVAAGTNPAAATAAASKEISRHLAEYRGTGIPPSIFQKINSDQRALIGKYALDRMVINFANSKGASEADVQCDWDSTQEVFVMRVNSAYETRTLNDITWEGNNLLEEARKSSPEAVGMSLEDAKKIRGEAEWYENNNAEQMRNSYYKGTSPTRWNR